MMDRVLNPAMILIGIGFLAAAGMKLADPDSVVEVFASWGVWSPVWIPLAAWIEVAIGLSLLNSPTRPLGSAALAAWLAGWAIVQFTAGASGAAIASIAFGLPAAGFAILSRRAWRPKREWIDPPLLNRPDSVTATAHDLARLVGLSFLVRWCVGGTAFWLALPVLGWMHARHAETLESSRLESVMLYLLVLGLGVSGLWGFVGHTFMSEQVANTIGWGPSPFQRELAFYHLGVGVAGLACWWVRDQFWLALVVISSVFLYGAGWVHLQEFLSTGNRAPTNWGFGVLFGSVIVPTALLWLAVARARRPGSGGMAPGS